MERAQQIEGILFYKSEPVTKTFLCDFLSISPEELEESLYALSEHLARGGTRLSMTDSTVQLVCAPELSEYILALRTEELKKSIGRAGAETLAIILYRGPLPRAHIDRIRGVNSTFILRNLLIRGLIERRVNPQNKLSFLYASTTNLLNHLGIQKREQLPQFETIMNALDSFEQEQETEKSQSDQNFFN